jgi:hypothetical protein
MKTLSTDPSIKPTIGANVQIQKSSDALERSLEKISPNVPKRKSFLNIACCSSAPRSANPASTPKPVIVKHKDSTRKEIESSPEVLSLFNRDWIFGQHDTAGMKMSSPNPNEILAQYEVACGIRVSTNLEPSIADQKIKERLSAILNAKSHWFDEYHQPRTITPNLNTTSQGDVMHLRHQFLKEIDWHLPKIDGERYLPIKATFADVADEGCGLRISMLEEIDTEAMPKDMSEARKKFFLEKFEHAQQICAEIEGGVVKLRMTATGRISTKSIGQKIFQIPNRIAVERHLKEHLGRIIDLLMNTIREFRVEAKDITKELLAR